MGRGGSSPPSDTPPEQEFHALTDPGRLRRRARMPTACSLKPRRRCRRRPGSAGPPCRPPPGQDKAEHVSRCPSSPRWWCAPGSHLGRGVALVGAHGGSRGAVAARSPDAVPVFDGVFLLRPQLNDAWDLRIFLEVDFQETLGCPRWTPGHQFWVSGFRCYAPARPSAPFARSDGLGARRDVPKDEMNAGQPLLPLVLLAALAAGRIRSTEGVRAVRVNTLASWRR